VASGRIAIGVGIGDAQPGENRGFASLHDLCRALGVVVVALQVQHAVYDKVSAVVGKRLSLLARLASKHGSADHEIPDHRRIMIVHEREDVCRVLLAAKGGVERGALPFADEAHRDDGVALERRPKPSPQGGFDRQRASEGLPIYLRLLHATIEHAIAFGCKRLSLGRTALEPKAALGAKPEPMSVWIRHRVPPVNWVLRGVLSGIGVAPGFSAEDTDGRRIGVVTEVLHHAGQELLVLDADGREVLVPFVTALVPTVDMAGGRLVVADRPGLVSGEPE